MRGMNAYLSKDYKICSINDEGIKVSLKCAYIGRKKDYYLDDCKIRLSGLRPHICR